MSQSFRFLVHRCFQEQLDEFLELKPGAWSSLCKQCEKACADPFRAGELMHSIVTKKLRTRIYRVWVKGPKGFRFIYLVDHSRQIVMGVFVSSEVKAKFDYEKVPWEEYAAEIYEDLISGNMEKFTELIFPD